jgi:hypothetical protein
MTTPTNYVIRQQIKNISNSKTIRVSSGSESGIRSEDEQIDVNVVNKKFVKIGDYGNEIIFYDNTKARIIHPMPCMKWSCKKAPDENGVVTLNTELEATVLILGDSQIVLGFPSSNCGLNKELELLIDLGDTELIMNNDFYSVKAAHHVKDGMEI